MKWFLIIMAILIAVLFLLVFTKIRVHFSYKRVQKDDLIHMRMTAWFGLFHYIMKVPVIKKDDESASLIVEKETGMLDEQKKESTEKVTVENLLNGLSDMRTLIHHIVDLHRIIRNFLGKIQVKEFAWHSVVGTKNAAQTGILTGNCWALKGSIIGLLTTYLDFRVMPIYTITPDFYRKQANTSITCIAEFRIGQAILTGIKLLRYWKGGKVSFKSKTLAKFSGDSNQQSM
ncbi:DUF2953 domain-containing protein [Peribacillus sp. NPDC097295]|uniref:DUF2953 domain-containing protein n=1 Tax=Peribacillus sp. NPDC097295 TaxID=3364402 RepID=UPI0037F884D7